MVVGVTGTPLFSWESNGRRRFEQSNSSYRTQTQTTLPHRHRLTDRCNEYEKSPPRKRRTFEYSERESNPHGHYWPQDFKSGVSTYSTIRALFCDANVVFFVVFSKLFAFGCAFALSAVALFVREHNFTANIQYG